MKIDKDIFDILAYYAQIGVRCNSPVEIDYHEYIACGKCLNCKNRRKLKASNIKQFNHF